MSHPDRFSSALSPLLAPSPGVVGRDVVPYPHATPTQGCPVQRWSIPPTPLLKQGGCHLPLIPACRLAPRATGWARAPTGRCSAQNSLGPPQSGQGADSRAGRWGSLLCPEEGESGPSRPAQQVLNRDAFSLVGTGGTTSPFPLVKAQGHSPLPHPGGQWRIPGSPNGGRRWGRKSGTNGAH